MTILNKSTAIYGLFNKYFVLEYIRDFYESLHKTILLMI